MEGSLAGSSKLFKQKALKDKDTRLNYSDGIKMVDEKSPSTYSLIKLDELREKIKSSKKIKIVLNDSQATQILEKSGYKVNDKIILNTDSSVLLVGNDGETPKISFGAIMPGSNVFIPKNNKPAFYKYFAEHKKLTK